MALSEEYTDLITPSQLADHALGELGPEVETALRAVPGSGDTEEIQQTALRHIKAATKMVQHFLGRILIISQHTARWKNDKYGNDWKEASEYTRATESPRYTAWFKQFPVVEVYSVDGDTTLADEITPEGDRLEVALIDFDGDLANFPTDAVYFAGFVRDDQAAPGSGDTWNNALSTSALTNLSQGADVAVLPQDIVACVGNIVMARMIWGLKGLVGVSESEITADRLKITSRKALEKYEKKQLHMIYHHRAIPF